MLECTDINFNDKYVHKQHWLIFMLNMSCRKISRRSLWSMLSMPHRNILCNHRINHVFFLSSWYIY